MFILKNRAEMGEAWGMDGNAMQVVGDFSQVRTLVLEHPTVPTQPITS